MIRFTICPIPKVTEEIMIARVRFSFSIALNRKPRKISSSRNPTHSMLITKRTLSVAEKRRAGLKTSLYRHTITSGIKNQA